MKLQTLARANVNDTAIVSPGYDMTCIVVESLFEVGCGDSVLFTSSSIREPIHGNQRELRQPDHLKLSSALHHRTGEAALCLANTVRHASASGERMRDARHRVSTYSSAPRARWVLTVSRTVEPTADV